MGLDLFIMSISRRTFIKAVMKCSLLQPFQCIGENGLKYELFDTNSNPPISVCIHVIGFGRNGKNVISRCKSESVTGLNYVGIDEGLSTSNTISFGKNTANIAELFFLVLDASDIGLLTQAASIARTVKKRGGVLVTLLSYGSDGIDDNEPYSNFVKDIVAMSDSVIDCVKAYDVSDAQCCSSPQNQADVISALIRSVYQQSFLSVDYADILYFIRSSPYIRSFTVNKDEYSNVASLISQITNDKDIIDFLFVNISGDNLMLADINDAVSHVRFYGDSIVATSYIEDSPQQRTYLLSLKSHEA